VDCFDAILVGEDCEDRDVGLMVLAELASLFRAWLDAKAKG